MDKDLVQYLKDNGGIEVIEKILAEKNLLEFTRQAWKVIEPGTEFSDNWHLHYLEEELVLLVLRDLGEAIGYSKEEVESICETELVYRVNINIPPRTMKSLFINVIFPCWVWIHCPSKKFITVSYSSDLSMELNKKRREIIESDWYQANWGHIVKLKEEQNTKTFFENTAQGSMFSTSIGGTLTGKGGDMIFLDDIQNPRMAESEADRKSVIDFIRQTLPSRLNNYSTGVIVNIQQRLHYNDASGFIIENYKDFYKFIVLPVTTDHDIVYTGPITKKQYLFRANESLWKERMPKSWIEQTKKEQGTRTYESQYLQDPAPEGGSLLQRFWFKKWKVLPFYNTGFAPKEWKLYQSWDMSFKGKQTADYVACAVLLTNGVTTYLVDYFKKQVGFLDTLDAVDDMREKWQKIFIEYGANIPIVILVEDKANGPAIIETLQSTIPGILPITPEEDKYSRMNSISPYVEAGNVYIPSIDTSDMITRYYWVEDALNDLTRFPYVQHDDFCDSFSQGCRQIYVTKGAISKELKIF